ncbi:DUF2493 domain-containing protein [Streptomyces virginiae]|uniref:DUF2493 domain-containing protein n=1 Tax=Streptomyces virginiae TaxID=1961 RepID=UPI00366040EF
MSQQPARPYRILVTGSRDWPDEQTIHVALAEVVSVIPADRDITIVHGGCGKGADRIAHRWARQYGAAVEVHYADWNIGRAAGPIRNRTMVNLGADVCLAFIHGRSRGASHCAHIAKLAGIPVRRWEQPGGPVPQPRATPLDEP